MAAARDPEFALTRRGDRPTDQSGVTETAGAALLLSFLAGDPLDHDSEAGGLWD